MTAPKRQKKTSTKTMSDESRDSFKSVVERTLGNIEQDRGRISQFMDELIVAMKSLGSEGEGIILAAQSFAKIADSLVKNNQLQINAAALIKSAAGEESDEDSVSSELGPLPFAMAITDEN